jgi:threonine dehydrogenase-like Zn-dependent dehydrogenase
MTLTAVAPHFAGDGKIVSQEREYPEPGPQQLLVRVEANAICGTDREQFYNGSDVVPGHEAAGSVVAAGPATTLPPGSRGAVFLMDYCGECRSCRIGATNQCMAKRADMGFDRDGGYGPYEIVHESNFFPVTDDITAVEATLLLDVMGTSGHAIHRAGLVRPDIESVYIAGAGPIGLGLLVAAKLRLGADVPVYLCDIEPWRLNYAAQLGGLPVDGRDEKSLAQLPPMDIAFDSTGKTTARRSAMDILGKRGALICVGHGESLTLNVSADLIAPERAVLGSEYFRYDEMQENLDLLRAHKSELTKVITHTFPVQQISDAFELFLSGRSGKVVITQENA